MKIKQINELPNILGASDDGKVLEYNDSLGEYENVDYTSTINAKLSDITQGINITIDKTNPQNPIINASGTFDVVNHNSLTNIQGGDIDEFYHLSLDGYNNVSNLSGTNTGDQDLGQYVTLNGNEILTNKNINGVSLNSTGSSTLFLNEEGLYSSPSVSEKHTTVVGANAFSVPTNTYTTVPLQYIEIDTSSSFDVITNKYTTPSNGKYLITMSSSMGTGAVNSYISRIMKNSTTQILYFNCYTGGGSNQVSSNNSKIVELSQNDTIEFQLYHTSGGNQSAQGGPSVIFLSIKQL